MKIYRCAHTVEAMCWTDANRDRERFTARFKSHNAAFETCGSNALLPYDSAITDKDFSRVKPGEWIVWLDNEFVVMDNELFIDQYSEFRTAFGRAHGGLFRSDR